MNAQTREFSWDDFYSRGLRGEIDVPWHNSAWIDASSLILRKWLDSKHPSSLLDFGCGCGVYVELYKEFVEEDHIDLIDISEVAIAECRKKFNGIYTSCRGLDALRKRDCRYDVIVCWGVLSHLNEKEREQILALFTERLNEDGILILGGWGHNAKRYEGAMAGVSPVTKTLTNHISELHLQLKRNFVIEERLSLGDSISNDFVGTRDEQLFDSFIYYVGRRVSKERILAYKYSSDLIEYLSDRSPRMDKEILCDKIYFFQLVKFAFNKSLLDATFNPEESFMGYWNKDVSAEVLNNAITSTSQFGSLTTQLYDSLDGCLAAFPVDGEGSFLRLEDPVVPFEKYGFHIHGKGTEALFNENVGRPFKFETISQFVGRNIIAMPHHATVAFDKSKALGKLISSQVRPLYFYVFKTPTLQMAGKQLGDGLLFVYAAKTLSRDELLELNFLFTRWAAVITQESNLVARNQLAIKSAIGSIMSRNGSHNIGSHVLAALSHNVGTMPDDRVLYQYIQNRMDYIATVTTDPPVWTQSTLLMGNLIRGFLVQYHLLDHIAESEGLRAYVFQMHSKKLNIRDENASGKIELHVRKQVVKGTYRELIEYDSGIVHLDDDVALAIPGGVVGTHAFYTILENVIRNAAKHGWSNPGKGVESRKANEGNLKVYVDFAENDEDVEFEVWDNMSNVFGSSNGEIAEELVAPLTKKELADCQQSNALKSDAVTGLPLHHQQQLKLAQKFITESGSLRQENWGLAEMKISAGFLVRRTVSEIGGLDEAVNDCERKDKRILLPKAVRHGDLYHLGYQFSIPKPMDVVFVLDKTSFAGEEIGRAHV